MSAEDAEEYTRALGQVMSGGWRQIALAQRLGVPEALGMTTDVWVRERIGGYVRLGLDERREAVKALTDPDGDFQLSQRQAAEVLGVDQATVSRALRGDASASFDGVLLEEDHDTDDADASREECAESSVEEPPIEPAPSPVVGDVLDDIREHFDEDGLAAEQAALRHANTMAHVWVTWLRFISENPPGVFSEGLDIAGLKRLVADLDRFMAWLEQARAVAAATRGLKKVP